MRRVEWSEWRERRRGLASAAAAVPHDRHASSRERTAEEREVLTRAVVAELRRAEAEGRLVRLGPRKVRYEVRRRRG